MHTFMIPPHLHVHVVGFDKRARLEQNVDFFSYVKVQLVGFLKHFVLCL